MKLAIVVGHTSAKPGASLVGSTVHEYDYNKEIASICYLEARHSNIDTKVYFRDLLGIKGVYSAINLWIGVDKGCAIELHFNSEASGLAQGTETLYDNDPVESKDLAEIIQTYICPVFQRTGKKNRGIKLLTKADRGGENMILAKVPSVIVEPFFGSNVTDANLALSKKTEYAHSLIRAAEKFSCL